jgi:membrane protein YdbS with pleckstrin-like domain
MAQDAKKGDEKKKAEPLPRIWRKHVFALIGATITQLLQIGFLLIAVIIGVALPGAAMFQFVMGGAVVFCGLWTTVHLIGDLAAARKASADKTPLSRRRALLSKFAAPMQVIMAGISGFLSIGVSLLVLASLFMQEPWLWAVIVSYIVFLVLWLGIEVVDWYNDQYILKEDRIVDITRIPIIYEQRTEAPLAMIQNASTSQKGMGVIFNYGDVTVETASAARPILFEFVWQPKKIQAAIFQQIDVAARKKQQRDSEERATQTQRWLEAYHTLTRGIREVRYERVSPAGRPVALSWTIEGTPDCPYRTWLAWDVVSRAKDNAYACWARPGGLLPYVREDEIDGVGAGVHAMRGWMPPEEARSVYFRVGVLFAGEQPTYSSPEMMIAIGPTA